MTIKYDFKIDQGCDHNFSLVLKDENGSGVNLVGYGAAMQVRSSPSSKIAIDTLTTANKRLEIDTDAGKIALNFPHDVTSTYPAAKLCYDMEIVSGGGQVTRLFSGFITVSPEVTRVEPSFQ